jgi:hypothetical protein
MDDTTYLLGTPGNAKRLLESIRELEAGRSTTTRQETLESLVALEVPVGSVEEMIRESDEGRYR